MMNDGNNQPIFGSYRQPDMHRLIQSDRAPVPGGVQAWMAAQRVRGELYEQVRVSDLGRGALQKVLVPGHQTAGINFTHQAEVRYGGPTPGGALSHDAPHVAHRQFLP